MTALTTRIESDGSEPLIAALLADVKLSTSSKHEVMLAILNNTNRKQDKPISTQRSKLESSHSSMIPLKSCMTSLPLSEKYLLKRFCEWISINFPRLYLKDTF